jgi:hypothetical protein
MRDGHAAVIFLSSLAFHSMSHFSFSHLTRNDDGGKEEKYKSMVGVYICMKTATAKKREKRKTKNIFYRVPCSVFVLRHHTLAHSAFMAK